MRTLEERIQDDTEGRTRRRMTKRGTQWGLQNSGGMNRREARRAAFGDTRREASSHMTRGQMLNHQSLARRIRLRAKRVQAVAAAQFTAALAEGGL